jgi:hypothetical protein
MINWAVAGSVRIPILRRDGSGIVRWSRKGVKLDNAEQHRRCGLQDEIGEVNIVESKVRTNSADIFFGWNRVDKTH